LIYYLINLTWSLDFQKSTVKLIIRIYT